MLEDIEYFGECVFIFFVVVVLVVDFVPGVGVWLCDMGLWIVVFWRVIVLCRVIVLGRMRG